MSHHDHNLLKSIAGQEEQAHVWRSPDDDPSQSKNRPVTEAKRLLVAKLLYGTGMTMVYGKGESKKTLFCLTVAVHVAAVGPNAPQYIGDPRTGLEIKCRGRTLIYSVEDEYDELNSRIWDIIEKDLGMDPQSDEAKTTRSRIRLLCPLSMSDDEFPFADPYLCSDNPEGEFRVNVKGRGLVHDINSHNAKLPADDPDRYALLVIDSATTTGGMELTDNLKATVYTWYFGRKSIQGDFACMVIAHTPKTVAPDKLDPEAGRELRLAGGFVWNTNGRATIEVRVPLTRGVSKSRGTLKGDDWWETKDLPIEHSDSIVVQVAKANSGMLSKEKFWFSSRGKGNGAFIDITPLMAGTPRSYEEWLRVDGGQSGADASRTSEQAKKVREEVNEMVLQACYRVAQDGKPITPNAVQTLILENDAFAKRFKDLLSKDSREGGLAKNRGGGATGSSAWHIDVLVSRGLLNKSAGRGYEFVGEEA
ncbi:AAA family ATPase [Qipengyuania citrea]|uniref:AAA family ATPase n=1 Tax=Qipengyuania citrea TaxID=225971 RepID=UPI003296E071